MGFFETWVYPDIPSKFSDIFNEDERKLVVVGVIGKSAFADCNKMAGLNVLDTHPSHLNHDCKEGQVRFYYSKSESMLFLHFETTYDEYCMRDLMFKEMENNEPGRYLNFNKLIRNRFAKMLLFALQVCHIIVYVELSVTFDASLMSILKSLKIIRDKYLLKLSPKLLKNSNSSTNLGKISRFCPPRCLFFFENYPDGYDKTEEAVTELEFEIENNIYKLFRSEQVIPIRGVPLLSLPANKRFVYYNTDDTIREDPLIKSLNDLQLTFEKSNNKDDTSNSLEELRPFGGFGKPLALNSEMRLEVEEKKTNFMTFLKNHVKEALQFAVADAGHPKFMGKGDFLIPSVKVWYENFKLYHKIILENPDNPDFEPTGTGYKNYIENFDKLMDIDGSFFAKCCDIGYKKACNLYSDPVLSHYGKSYQKSLQIDDPLAVYSTYARGPNIAVQEQKLRENYEQYWMSGKGQSESAAIRANTCTLSKPNAKDSISDLNELTLASTCTCGRIQACRDDPYSMRQENYEFHQIFPDSCLFCEKNKRNVNHVLKTTVNDYK